MPGLFDHPKPPSAVRLGVFELGGLLPWAAGLLAAWSVLVLRPMGHDLAGFVASWFVMSAAMMLPTVYRPMRRVAQGRADRLWAFTAGYVLVWSIAGVPAYLLMTVFPDSSLLLALLWLLVGAYLQTPFALRSFSSCKSLATTANPLSAGSRQGVNCLIGCWPVMVMAMVTLMALNVGTVVASAVMFALMWVMVWQKGPRRSESALRSVGVAIIIGAALLAVSGDFGVHQHNV